MIEEYLAYGLATVHVVSRHGGVEIAEAMRELGFGVTEVPGYGRDGGVELVQTVVQRQHLDQIAKIVERWDPDAFVTVEEPRILRGGSIVGRRKNEHPMALGARGQGRFLRVQRPLPFARTTS